MAFPYPGRPIKFMLIPSCRIISTQNQNDGGHCSESTVCLVYSDGTLSQDQNDALYRHQPYRVAWVDGMLFLLCTISSQILRNKHLLSLDPPWDCSAN